MHDLVRQFVGGDIQKALDKSKLVKKKVSVKTKTGKVVQVNKWVKPNKNEPKKERSTAKASTEGTKGGGSGGRVFKVKNYNDVKKDIENDVRDYVRNKFNDIYSHAYISDKISSYHLSGIITKKQKEDFRNKNIFDKLEDKYEELKEGPTIKSYDDAVKYLTATIEHSIINDIPHGDMWEKVDDDIESLERSGVITREQEEHLQDSGFFDKIYEKLDRSINNDEPRNPKTFIDDGGPNRRDYIQAVIDKVNEKFANKKQQLLDRARKELKRNKLKPLNDKIMADISETMDDVARRTTASHMSTRDDSFGVLHEYKDDVKKTYYPLYDREIIDGHSYGAIIGAYNDALDDYHEKVHDYLEPRNLRTN